MKIAEALGFRVVKAWQGSSLEDANAAGMRETVGDT